MPDSSVSLGLNAKEMYDELNRAEAKYRQVLNRISQSGPASVPRPKTHPGEGRESSIGFKSENRVEHGVTGLVGDLANVQNGYQAVSASAETAARILRLPLGIGIAIGAGAVLLEKLHEKYVELKKANLEARAELLKPFAGGSIEQLTHQLESADEAIKNIGKSRTLLAVAADFYTHGFNAKETKEGNKNEQALSDRKFEISAEIAKNAKEAQEAEDISANHSARKGELLKAELATREKIAAIDADDKLFPDAKIALKRQASAAGEINKQGINDKFDARDRSLLADRDVNFVKRSGDNVDVRTAEGKVAAAKGDQTRATTSEEKAAAQGKVDAAEAELEVVRQTTAEKHSQQELEVKNANIVKERGREQEAQLQVLKNEQATLQKNLKTAKPDDARDLKVKIAQNASAQRDVVRAIDDAKTARENENREALIGAEIIEAQIKHQDVLAEALRLRLSYIEKIEKAERAGDTKTANSLRKEGNAAIGQLGANVTQQKREGSKLTLEDLAQNGTGVIGGEAGKAREVLRLEQQARTLSLNARAGHPEDIDAAVKVRDRARDLKQGIGSLKDSEKESGLKEAASQLKEAASALKAAGTNQ